MKRPRILSGMRPTGPLHLGNYMGALENWVRLQDAYECFFIVADWHALTTDYADPGAVRENVLEVATDWLAAGLDPARSTLFIQSLVPQHAELHLLLSMIMPVPWLERVPTYKEQQQELTGKDLSTYGFLGYPLLQTADIIVYKADAVPVGEDQVPHVELTREIVRRFNNLYGEVFPEPKTAAHRGEAHPGHRRPQDVEVLRQRDLPQGRPGDRPPEAAADGHRPGPQAPDRPRRPRDLPGVRPAQGLLARPRRRPGRPRAAARRESAASTARRSSPRACWRGSPRSTSVGASSRSARTRCGTSSWQDRRGRARSPRRRWTTCAAAMKIRYDLKP